MSDVIYLDAKNNVVTKDRAVKCEMYVRDKSGKVVQRIYGRVTEIQKKVGK